MLVERLMHLEPPKVIGYVLDGIVTSSGASADKFNYFSTYDTAFGEVGDAFLALCEGDKECNDRFSPKGLQDALQDLILQVDNDSNSTNYKANGIIYERDQYWNKAATIPKGVSVLLLQGKLDARTAPKYAEYLLEVLDGREKELITFEYAIHGVVRTTTLNEGDYTNATCGMMLLASYVSNGGDLKRLDKSCVDKMPAFNLTSSYDTRYQYLNTDDAYDGAFTGEEESSSSHQ
ncbi:hypothetical protein JM16_009677, partial [Phytophthora kernoviae]